MAKAKSTGTEVAVPERQQMTPAKRLAADIQNMADQYAQALPEGVSLEKFVRTTMTAIQNTPALLNADRRSLFHAISRAAQDGLMPDGRQGAIVTFGQAAQWMPMVYGRRLQAARNGVTIDAQVVYEYEVEHGLFKVTLGDNASLHHEPAPFGVDRGEIVGAYAIATLPDGTKIRELMHRDEIEKVRAVSRSGGKGPWKDWFSEMCRKTVINRISKSIPDTDFRSSIVSEEEELAQVAAGGNGTIIDPPTVATGRPSALRRAMGKAAESAPADDDTPPDADADAEGGGRTIDHDDNDGLDDDAEERGV